MTPAAPQPPARPATDVERWFKEEVHAHDGQLRAYLRGSFPTVDVDDVVQESYLRVWRRHAAHPIALAKNFLFSVARNLACDCLRRERVSPVGSVRDLAALATVADDPGLAEGACRNEETAVLLEAIDSLPGRCRQIFRLRKLHGLSHQEIATRLGISAGTVETQIGRATRRCEEYLRRRGVLADSES
jgi:RNA polymerase sigma-70 factor (ECF subfamily)